MNRKLKARLIERTKFVDDRGHFENIPFCLLNQNPSFKAKRVYVCNNFQTGTVRGYHYHKYEQKMFICLRGAVKFILLPGDMMQTKNPTGWSPATFILTPDMNQSLFIPGDYANAWQSLADDTILLGVSDKTIEESYGDDVRLDPTLYHPEYWETKWR